MSDFLGPKPLTAASIDAAITGKINTPGSATATALSATYARPLRDRMTPMARTVFPNALLAAGSPSFPGVVLPPFTAQSGTFWNSPNIRHLSGTPTAVDSSLPNGYLAGSTTRTSGSSGNTPTHIGFIYHGSHFALHVSTVGTTDVQIYIDGMPFWSAPQTFPAAGGQFIDVDLANRGTYDVRVVLGNATFIQVVHESLDTVRAPATKFRAGWDGDSYGDMGIDNIFSGLPGWVADRTGWEIIHFAQGSTGWAAQLDVADPLKTPFESTERAALKGLHNLDLLVVAGSINSGLQTPAAVAAALVTYCARVKAVAPNLPIVVGGVQPWNYGTSQPQIDNNTAMRNQAASIDNVVAFVDWFELRWLTGTGSTAAPAFDGNQDYMIGSDDIHPSPEGNKWLGENWAAALAEIRIPG